MSFNLLAQRAEEAASRHQSARKLIDMMEIREQLPQTLGSFLEAATKQMTASQPDGSGCNQEFLTERKKRFSEQMSADRVIEVIVPVFEKHFTTEELDQLTAMRIASSRASTRNHQSPFLRSCKGGDRDSKRNNWRDQSTGSQDWC